MQYLKWWWWCGGGVCECVFWPPYLPDMLFACCCQAILKPPRTIRMVDNRAMWNSMHPGQGKAPKP